MKENYPRYPVTITVLHEPDKRPRTINAGSDQKTTGARANPFGTAFDNNPKQIR